MRAVVLANDADAIRAAQNDLVPSKADESGMTGRGRRPTHRSSAGVSTGDVFLFREDQRIAWPRRFGQYKVLARRQGRVPRASEGRLRFRIGSTAILWNTVHCLADVPAAASLRRPS